MRGHFLALIAPLVATSLLFTSCDKGQHYADVQQLSMGTWIPDWNTNLWWNFEQSSSGNAFSIRGVGKSEGWASGRGTWAITNDLAARKFLILTMTNSPWENGISGVMSYRILQMDDHEMMLVSGTVASKIRKK